MALRKVAAASDIPVGEVRRYEVDVDFETIECPKHGSTFDLNTGNPRTLPATMPVRAYRVKVEEGDIVIEVDE